MFRTIRNSLGAASKFVEKVNRELELKLEKQKQDHEKQRLDDAKKQLRRKQNLYAQIAYDYNLKTEAEVEAKVQEMIEQYQKAIDESRRNR